MKTFLMVKAELRRSKSLLFAVGLILALSFSLSAATMMTERMIKESSARAADYFDLIIGAKNNPVSLLLGTVYLQDEPLPTVPGELISELKKKSGIQWFAPMAVGDRVENSPVVGTTEELATFGGSLALQDGRMFSEKNEAVVGSASGFRVGDQFLATHGRVYGIGHDHREVGKIHVVGRLASTGTPWDKAVLIPIEYVWEAHGFQLNGKRFKELTVDELKKLPGLSATIVKPVTVADAYKLRQAFNKTTFEDGKGNLVGTTGIFTGEVLVSLYSILDNGGKAFAIINLLTLIMGLVVALSSGWVIATIRADSFTQLRLLGAPASYVRQVIFSLVMLTVIASVIIGCGLAFIEAEICAYYLTVKTGIVMHPVLSLDLLWLAIGTLLVAFICAWFQSLFISRKPLS